MAWGHRSIVSLVLLGLGLALVITVLAVVLSRHHSPCSPQAFAHAAVAADSKVCSDIGRAILQQQGSPVDATIAALVCSGVVNPQSMGLGGGVIFTIYNATTGKVEVINARETVPARFAQGLLDQCELALPLGTGTQWIGVPGELRGYAEAHRRHGRLPWAQLFQPTIALLRGDFRMPSVLSQFLSHKFLQPLLYNSTLRQLFFNGTKPLRSQDPFPWSVLATTLETVATEGDQAFYTGRLGQMLVDDIVKEGGQLTMQDLATFQPEVVDALEMPLGNYTLYSPPPPSGGAILSFILNVLRGFNFSAESVAQLEGRVNMYHHLVETLKFAGGQRWRQWDPRSHPEVQNASQELLGEALAQHIRQQINDRGDHQRSHYNLAGDWGHRMGTSHVSVLGEDGSAVSATSTINTPRASFSTMSSWTCAGDAGQAPTTGPHPVRARPPARILQASPRERREVPAAIASPILHVNSKGGVEYEANFSQEVQKGLQDRGQKQTQQQFFLNVVQAVSQEGPCVYAASDLRKSGVAAGY
nr:glutathione hydrolase 5 proenzyme isoform X5 [Cavia porcellus]